METVRLAATLESLGSVAEFSTRLAEDAGLAEADAFRLRLALDELFTNITTHAFRTSSGEIELVGSAECGRVTAEVIDGSPPFDPVHSRRRRDGDPFASDDQYLGGFGLILIREVSDHLEYRRVDGENRTTIVVCRADADPGVRRPRRDSG